MGSWNTLIILFLDCFRRKSEVSSAISDIYFLSSLNVMGHLSLATSFLIKFLISLEFLEI